MALEHLKLDNQICFPIYAASRLVIREYQPYLSQLGITYAQYLVLLVLWEQDGVPVSAITGRLFLNTNTVTPILKRMEALGLLTRRRSSGDAREVIVALTVKGKEMEAQAATIPERLASGLMAEDVDPAELLALKEQLDAITRHLSARDGTAGALVHRDAGREADA